jgi:monofunctional glycosyltransferase
LEDKDSPNLNKSPDETSEVELAQFEDANELSPIGPFDTPEENSFQMETTNPINYEGTNPSISAELIDSSLITEEKVSHKEKFEATLKDIQTLLTKIILSPFVLMRLVCLLTGAFVILLTIFFTLYVVDFFGSLPDIESKSFKDIKLDAVLKVHKNFRNERTRKKYFWVPLHKINRELIYAVIMSEDSTFLEHNGVNFNAMIDSLATNIRKREYQRGASTITQQVVKNVYINQDKTISRKLKEILIARDLESKFSKNEILEIYLNIAEFGPELYGVGMSGFHFFRRSTKNITADQGAYLALMLPSPRRNYFSIHDNHYISKKNSRKMNRILRDMRYLEYLSPKQYNERRKFSFIKELFKE